MRNPGLCAAILALVACGGGKSGDKGKDGGSDSGPITSVTTGTLGTGTATGAPTTTLSGWPCLTADLPPGGTDDPSNRKTVSYTIRSGASPDVALGDLILTRARANSTSIRYILPVTNLTDAPLCYVKLVNVDFLDVAGGVVASEASNIAHGLMSVTTAGGIETNACLEPGFTGYFHGMADFDLAGVNGAAFDLENQARAGTLHPTTIRPTSVTVLVNNLFVEAEHLGGPDATLSETAPFILFDAGGNPIFWAFLNATGPQVLSEGDTWAFEDDMSTWEIAGASLCATFDYTSAP